MQKNYNLILILKPKARHMEITYFIMKRNLDHTSGFYSFNVFTLKLAPNLVSSLITTPNILKKSSTGKWVSK